MEREREREREREKREERREKREERREKPETEIKILIFFLFNSSEYLVVSEL